jgi:hypothetical protein
MSTSPHPDPNALLDEAAAGWPGTLPEVPADLVATREALHAVAERVVSPARQRATGNEIALRWYPGGFGTPAFHDDRGARVVRVEGTDLVDACDGSERRTPLTSLSATGKLVGDLVDTHELTADPLAIDPGAAGFLADWFRFATLVIAELQVGAAAELDPGWVQLWPEHFDVATELGSEEAGVRAAYGASPGDAQHPEPYVYVAPWSAKPDGELWNATGFTGAELTYAELRAAADPRAAAAEFFAARVADLTG